MTERSLSEERKRAEALGEGYAEARRLAREELVQSAKAYAAGGGRIIVLDDDLTGVQTVHDVPVYTDWSEETFRQILQGSDPLAYVLTNSRGLDAAATTQVHTDIAMRIRAIAEHLRKAGGSVPFQLISRSDSTLRGHFPLEIDVLEQVLGAGVSYADGVILAPFFAAGGRLTVDDIHFVAYGDRLVPASETEFAKDATFGYAHSDLRDYVEEKTKGRWKAEDVISIGLPLLRRACVEEITKLLEGAGGGVPVIVNALEPSDMEVFACALYRALSKGKRFLYRTAADFVKAFGAISDRPLLSGSELRGNRRGTGVVVVGSHTKKTTGQLEKLSALPGTDLIPFRASLVMSGGLAGETERVRALIDEDLARSVVPVVYTERAELSAPGDTKESALARSVEISEALTPVIRGLKNVPAYVIAKGGITSSDVGVKGLGVKKAVVAGQILPGIPVWQCGEESAYPGMPYVIFPGNVGEEDDLRRIVEILEEKPC